MRIFSPEVFQGRLSSGNYFEGWYFKNVNASRESVYSFIPGVSLNSDNPHAFIQVINGITGDTEYVEYPLESFRYEKKYFRVEVGKSVFSKDSMLLDINTATIRVKGELQYSKHVLFPSSLTSPGIMGWYSFVPFMECKHGVVSVSHVIQGSLSINDKQVDFSGGKGYIEKDWGKSFPEAWIWLQSNHFELSDACIMVSIAKIPWLGHYFSGLIAFLYLDGKFYHFTTYNGTVIKTLNHNDKQLNIILMRGEEELRISAAMKNAGTLIAPVSGKMSRRIKESVDSEIEVELLSRGTLIYKDKAVRTGLEVIEKIFEIVKPVQ